MNLIKKKYGIGLDLGGSSLKYALIDNEGNIVKENKRNSLADEKKSIILTNISEAIIEMKKYATAKDIEPVVVGFGTPGSVDIKKGYLLGSTPNFKYWREVRIVEELQKTINLPVFIDNDANLMAIAEASYGAGRGFKNIICITVGTGIGGAIIINGELYRGFRYAGAELGHMSIKYDGVPCNCGGAGCLERYASASAMTRNFAKYCKENNIEIPEKKLNVKYIFDQYNKGNRIAEKTIEESVYFLGRGIANFINIFNPEIIIIGGGVADAGDIYINKVKEITWHYAMDEAKKKVKLVRAKLGNKAGCLGAVKFAFDNIKS